MGKETQIALGVIGVLTLIVALVVVTRIKGLAPHPDASIDRATSVETDAGPARVTRPPTIVQPTSEFSPANPSRLEPGFNPLAQDPTSSGSFDPPRTYLPLRSEVDDPTIRVQRPSHEPSYLPRGGEDTFQDDRAGTAAAFPAPVPDPDDPARR